MKLTQLDPEALLESLQAGVVVHGADTKILYANRKALELMRLTQAQVLGADALDPKWKFLDKYEHEMPLEGYPVYRVLKTGRPIENLEVGVVDGSQSHITWVLCNGYPEFDNSGQLVHIVISFIDITYQKKEIPFQDIVELASDAIVVTEAKSIVEDGPKFVYVNKAFTELTGFTPEDVIGKTPRIMQGPDTSLEAREHIRVALEKKQPVREQLVNYGKDGRRYWLDMNISPLLNDFGEVSYFVAVERDVTEQKNQEAKLKDLSERDSLTGLLNRRGFLEAAQASLCAAQRSKTVVSMVLIDIDYFKQINDRFGHKAGDLALICLGKKLSESFRRSDLVGRLGGEEFGVLLFDTELEAACKLLEQLRLEIAECTLMKGSSCETEFAGSGLSVANLDEVVRNLKLTVSIGVVQSPARDLGAAQSDQSFEEQVAILIDQADQAMYLAKREGRNRVCVKS